MQGSYSSSDRTESGIFGRVLASSHSLFTPKRVGFTLAGAFVFAGAAAAIGTGGSQQPSHTKSQNFTVQTSSDNTTGTQNTPTEPQAAADTNSTTKPCRRKTAMAKALSPLLLRMIALTAP
jgi:hypothetical protein